MFSTWDTMLQDKIYEALLHFDISYNSLFIIGVLFMCSDFILFILHVQIYICFKIDIVIQKYVLVRTLVNYIFCR